MHLFELFNFEVEEGEEEIDHIIVLKRKPLRMQMQTKKFCAKKENIEKNCDDLILLIKSFFFGSRLYLSI